MSYHPHQTCHNCTWNNECPTLLLSLSTNFFHFSHTQSIYHKAFIKYSLGSAVMKSFCHFSSFHNSEVIIYLKSIHFFFILSYFIPSLPFSFLTLLNSLNKVFLNCVPKRNASIIMEWREDVFSLLELAQDHTSFNFNFIFMNGTNQKSLGRWKDFPC